MTYDPFNLFAPGGKKKPTAPVVPSPQPAPVVVPPAVPLPEPLPAPEAIPPADPLPVEDPPA